MLHAVADHRGRHALRRKLHSALMGLGGQRAEEYIVYQVVDGQTYIVEHLIRIFHGNTGIDHQIGHQVVAAPLLEFTGKVRAPVLRATLPGIYVHVFHHIMMRALHKQVEPSADLFLYGIGRELVAFQSLCSAGRGIGMTGRGVADAVDMVCFSCCGQLYAVTGQLERDDVFQGDGITVVISRCSGLDSPHRSRLSFEAIHLREAVEHHVLKLQVCPPFGGIQVFAARFTAFGRPKQTDISGCRLGQRIGEVETCALPSLPRRCQLSDITESDAIVRGLHQQPLALDIVAAWNHFYTAHRPHPSQVQQDIAGIVAAEHPALVSPDIGNAGIVCCDCIATIIYHSLHFRHWHGKHGDILVVLSFGYGSLQHHHSLIAAHDGIAPHHFLHGFLGRNPWAAGQGKAVADMDSHLQSQRVCLLESVVHHFPELWSQLVGLAFIFGPFFGAPDGHQVAAAQSHVFHALQVGLNAVL